MTVDDQLWVKSRVHGVQALAVRHRSKRKARGGPEYVYQGVYVGAPRVDVALSERYVFDSEDKASRACIDLQVPASCEHQQ